LLLAESAWAIRRTLYEAEAYLAQHPESVDGRLLKDRAQTALKRMEKMKWQTQRADREYQVSPRRWDHRRSGLPLACIILVAAGIGAVVYLAWKLLF
jgi:hypothetical protein